MILYFSATGNSKYVAEQIAKATGDIAVSITDCIRDERYNFEISDEEDLGIVAPVYFWGLPNVVIDFFRKASFSGGSRNYVYHVATCGMFSGGAHRMMEHVLNAKGWYLHGKFSIRMVGTWTPLFNLANQEKNLRKTKAAQHQISRVIMRIQDKVQVSGFGHNKFFIMISPMIYSKYANGRQTDHFIVDSSCIGCGICERVCPTAVLCMKDGRPTWTQNQCNLCLACLHHCPENAIQYTEKTRGRGQFVHPEE